MTPDTRLLLNLPTWYPSSRRRAGWPATLLAKVWTSLTKTYIPLREDIRDFQITNPLEWHSSQDAEIAFLSQFPTPLGNLLPTTAGTEHDFGRLYRLLILQLLRLSTTPLTSETLGWALTAAFGRAIVIQPPPTGAYYPELSGFSNHIFLFDASDPNSLDLRTNLLTSGTLISESPLVTRPPGPFYGGGIFPAYSRYSPFGRTGILRDTPGTLLPIPTDSQFRPLPANGPTAYATLTTLDVDQLSVSVYGRSEASGTIRPGFVSPALVIHALSSTLPTQIRTIATSRLRGDPLLRTPGNTIPTPFWAGLTGSTTTPSWSSLPSSSPGPGLPLDLDNNLPCINLPPVSGNPYGSGTSPLNLPYDHPLASDYA